MASIARRKDNLARLLGLTAASNQAKQKTFRLPQKNFEHMASAPTVYWKRIGMGAKHQRPPKPEERIACYNIHPGDVVRVVKGRQVLQGRIGTVAKVDRERGKVQLVGHQFASSENVPTKVTDLLQDEDKPIDNPRPGDPYDIWYNDVELVVGKDPIGNIMTARRMTRGPVYYDVLNKSYFWSRRPTEVRKWIPQIDGLPKPVPCVEGDYGLVRLEDVESAWPTSAAEAKAGTLDGLVLDTVSGSDAGRVVLRDVPWPTENPEFDEKDYNTDNNLLTAQNVVYTESWQPFTPEQLEDLPLLQLQSRWAERWSPATRSFFIQDHWKNDEEKYAERQRFDKAQEQYQLDLQTYSTRLQEWEALDESARKPEDLPEEPRAPVLMDIPEPDLDGFHAVAPELRPLEIEFFDRFSRKNRAEFARRERERLDVGRKEWIASRQERKKEQQRETMSRRREDRQARKEEIDYKRGVNQLKRSGGLDSRLAKEKPRLGLEEMREEVRRQKEEEEKRVKKLLKLPEEGTKPDPNRIWR